MAGAQSPTPIRRIPVLRPVDWWCPPRLSLRFYLVLYLATVAASAIVGRALRLDGPVWAVVFIMFSAGAYWFWERRPAAWLVDQGDGSIAVHHRNVFFLPMTGQELATLTPIELRFEDGPWWRLGHLLIDGAPWQVLDDGQDAARHLASRHESNTYGSAESAPL